MAVDIAPSCPLCTLWSASVFLGGAHPLGHAHPFRLQRHAHQLSSIINSEVCAGRRENPRSATQGRFRICHSCVEWSVRRGELIRCLGLERFPGFQDSRGEVRVIH